jgi:hypothetical protein
MVRNPSRFGKDETHRDETECPKGLGRSKVATRFERRGLASHSCDISETRGRLPLLPSHLRDISGAMDGQPLLPSHYCDTSFSATCGNVEAVVARVTWEPPEGYCGHRECREIDLGGVAFCAGSGSTGQMRATRFRGTRRTAGSRAARTPRPRPRARRACRPRRSSHGR